MKVIASNSRKFLKKNNDYLSEFQKKKKKEKGCPRGVSEFGLQSRYYVHFRANTLGKCMNPLILPAMD